MSHRRRWFILFLWPLRSTSGTPRPYLHITHGNPVLTLEDAHFLRLGYQGDAKVKIGPCLDFTHAFTSALDSLRAATEEVFFFFTHLIYIHIDTTHTHTSLKLYICTQLRQPDLQLYIQITTSSSRGTGLHKLLSLSYIQLLNVFNFQNLNRDHLTVKLYIIRHIN